MPLLPFSPISYPAPTQQEPDQDVCLFRVKPRASRPAILLHYLAIAFLNALVSRLNVSRGDTFLIDSSMYHDMILKLGASDDTIL